MAYLFLVYGAERCEAAARTSERGGGDLDGGGSAVLKDTKKSNQLHHACDHTIDGA
jgi:hypothetical protein